MADIGNHITGLGPHADTFIAQGDTLALAPPATEATAATPALPGFKYGLFDVTRAPWDRDAGLRWVTQRWATSDQLAGAQPLATLAQTHRAERWQLLYVALSQAQKYLVIPLPRRYGDADQRDYWVSTLQAAFEFDGRRSAGHTYTCNAPNGDCFRIRVADPTSTPQLTAGDSAIPAIATANEDITAPLKPRFIRPSGYWPLLDAPVQRLVPYVQHRQLTPNAGTVEATLGLTFETVGPEAVGDIAHAVIEAAIVKR